MPTNNNVKIKEIAEKLSLSVGTVSIVLNGRGDAMRISKETQERVRTVAQEMNYQPNIFARRLRNAGNGMPERVYIDTSRKKLIQKDIVWNSFFAFFIQISCFRNENCLLRNSSAVSLYME